MNWRRMFKAEVKLAEESKVSVVGEIKYKSGFLQPSTNKSTMVEMQRLYQRILGGPCKWSLFRDEVRANYPECAVGDGVARSWNFPPDKMWEVLNTSPKIVKRLKELGIKDLDGVYEWMEAERS